MEKIENNELRGGPRQGYVLFEFSIILFNCMIII